MDYAVRLRSSALLAVCVWIIWLSALGSDAFRHVVENWQVTLTMVFGSIIAGATSEGGGAVAFPVFTKILHIDPGNARLFSLAIQSIGMTAASIIIIVSRIPVEWRVILWASIGGAVGVVFGAFVVAPLSPPDVTKMTFTIMTSSFALVLAVLNRGERRCHATMPVQGPREVQILLVTGFIGGILSSMVGTGLDILTFSVIVLLFRISEKVATPTSVILMAINSMVGLFVYTMVLGQMNDNVFGYWMAAVPVVVVGAPLGAVACAYMSRQVIANILIGLITIELISSLLIIPMRETVVVYSLVTLAGCLTIYFLMFQSQRYELLRVPQSSGS